MTEKNKKVLFTFILLIVAGFAIYGFVMYQSKMAESEEKYQHALREMGHKDFIYAELVFNELSGYKDADMLAVYCGVAHDAGTFLKYESELTKSLSVIPDDYSGDRADDIKAFREYLANDYTKEREAHRAGEAKLCLKVGCNNLRKTNGFYCSQHECRHAGCTYLVEEGSNYCKSHQSDEKQTTTDKKAKSSSKTGNPGSQEDPDPDDYDVDGFYEDNRGDFENEDDAWDYMEDEPDDWD